MMDVNPAKFFANETESDFRSSMRNFESPDETRERRTCSTAIQHSIFETPTTLLRTVRRERNTSQQSDQS